MYITKRPNKSLSAKPFCKRRIIKEANDNDEPKFNPLWFDIEKNIDKELLTPTIRPYILIYQEYPDEKPGGQTCSKNDACDQSEPNGDIWSDLNNWFNPN